MGVCASLAAYLCFPVCLCLLCFEANKYDDDDDDDDWCVRGNWSTLDTRKSRRAQNAGVSERQQILAGATSEVYRAAGNNSDSACRAFASAAPPLRRRRSHTTSCSGRRRTRATRCAASVASYTRLVCWLVGWSRV